MANVIKIKRGAEVPTTNAQLAPGEIGFNTTDDSLYMNKGTNTTPDIVRIGEDADSILTKVKTVDGASSGLDADLLDGKHASAFALAAHDQAWSTITSKPAQATRWPTWTEVTSKPANSQFPNTAEAIGASKNLNNYTTPGFYYQSANASAANGSNYPVARAGTLIVTKDAGTTQMYYEYNGSGVYYRTFYSSTWTAWQNLVAPKWANVSSKPAQATRWPAWSEVTSKPTTATRWPTWSEVTSKPSTFSPSTHSHAWSTITSKPSTFAPSSHTHTTGTKSTSGYVKFDNGLKLNWVQVTISASTRGKTFTWPSAFTSAVYATWASSKYYDMQGGVDGATKTGGTVNAGACSNGGTVGVSITWTAYGIGV